MLSFVSSVPFNTSRGIIMDEEELLRKATEQYSVALNERNKLENLRNNLYKMYIKPKGTKGEIIELQTQTKKLIEELETIKNSINSIEKTNSFLSEYGNLSMIFDGPSDYLFIIERLLQTPGCKNKKVRLNKIYQSSQSGFSIAAFRHKCNNIPNNIILVKTAENQRFGGFTQLPWEGNDVNEKKDDNAFCFSLTKKKIYNVIKGKTAIGDYKNYGPYFLYNIFYIGEGKDLRTGHCGGFKGSHYSGESVQYEINDGQPNFTVEEIEFYQVIFE